MKRIGQFLAKMGFSKNRQKVDIVDAIVPIVKQDPNKIAVLRFFFDFGAGGCLWNGDKTSYELFDGGTLERAEFDLDGNMRELPFILLSKATLLLIDELDTINYYYLNQKYQPDPSPWRQSLCDEFNSKIDELLLMIIDQIGDKFEIVDTQIRYQEDPHLDAYLGQNPDVLALNTIADVKRLIEKGRIFF